MDKYIIDNKSKAFALQIIRLCKQLNDEKYGYLLSKQLLRSGTSIGANIRERLNAQSRADFISKLQIALKEADETAYWLELLVESDIIDQKQFALIYRELKEIIAIITASINTLKNS
ncbi:MAG: four helix bundle protein [Alistipes sp.]|nr:four helix bundle protein [Alistipes sp.]